MEPTKQQQDLSLLAHLLGIISGFIGPLIVFLVVDENKMPFAKDQAKEALNFQLFILICYIGASILTLVLIGFILWLVIAVFALVFCIIAGVEASKGKQYRYPLTIRFIK